MNHAQRAPEVRIADYWLHEVLPSRSAEIAYRATHRLLPRAARVAIVRPGCAGPRAAEAQLMREACVLETLHHSGVPRVFECGVVDGRSWVASEHIVGASIAIAAGGRPLSISDALAVLRDTAAILAHAHHRRVVHRDLGPRSIVRTPQRSFGVCIVDWGAAAVDGGDAAADVFALGAAMFEAAALAPPAPEHKLPGVPVAFHHLLAAMLARAPDERPTAAAVHAEAARLAELYSDGDAAIEEVEVELVDIFRAGRDAP